MSDVNGHGHAAGKEIVHEAEFHFADLGEFGFFGSYGLLAGVKYISDSLAFTIFRTWRD